MVPPMKGLGFGVNEVRQFITIGPTFIFAAVTTPFFLLVQLRTDAASLRDKSGYVSIALLVTGVWLVLGTVAWGITAPLTACVPIALFGALVTALGVVIDRRFLLVGNMYQYATKDFPPHLGIDWDELRKIRAAPFALSSVRLWLLRAREWRLTWLGSMAYFIAASTAVDIFYPFVQGTG